MAHEGLDFLDKVQAEFNLANGERIPNYVLIDVANRLFMFSNCNLEPLNIEEVSKQLGFTYLETEFISKSMRAVIGIDKKYLNLNEDGMVLKVSKNEAAEDKLFLATYLLGNFVLNSKSRTMYYNLLSQESSYNEDVLKFTRILLMEEKVFSSAFMQEADKAKSNQQLLSNLSKRFHVSETLIQERIDDLKLN